jgi:hypothetical protein
MLSHSSNTFIRQKRDYILHAYVTEVAVMVFWKVDGMIVIFNGIVTSMSIIYSSFNFIITLISVFVLIPDVLVFKYGALLNDLVNVSVSNTYVD